MSMPINFTEGVTADTVAREWRLKWSDKKALAAVQKAADAVAPALANVPGVKSMNRVVCGGCYDYKLQIALDAESFGAWEKNNFEPEAKFLAAVGQIPEVTTIETQTYTVMPFNAPLIIYHVSISVKPEFVEAFATASADNAAGSVLEPGVARFDCIQDSSDPTEFMLIEVFKSKDAVQEHKKTAHYLKWAETVEKMMAKPRTKKTFHNVYPTSPAGFSSKL